MPVNRRAAAARPKFCLYCGAAKALVKSMEGTADTQECSITRREVSAFDALNLQVWTSPFSVFDHRLVLNSILDIAHEKSLRSFERIFFHDIMNAVTGIKGLHDIFALEIGERYRSELDLLHGAVESIRDIIESHKDFLEVETREYQCCHSRIETRALLGLMVTFCQVFNSGNRKVLRVDPDAPSLTFHSDPRLLQRILVNMVKNALEASSPGDVVTLGCQPGLDRSVTFQVRNPAVMSEEVRMRVFEKGFSTKGVGRGFGTYGMRLFAETCLGGRIHFLSTPQQGTVFLPGSPGRKPTASPVSGASPPFLSPRARPPFLPSWRRRHRIATMPDTMLVRLNKALAGAGYCSRRQADTLVAAGRVAVNGRPRHRTGGPDRSLARQPDRGRPARAPGP